jgi:hypothetical protein
VKNRVWHGSLASVVPGGMELALHEMVEGGIDYHKKW